MYFWVNIFSQLKNDRPLLWSRRNLDGPCALETVHLRLYTKTDYPKRLKVDGPKGENRTVFGRIGRPKGFGPKHSRVSVQKTVRFSPLVPFTFWFLDRPVCHMTAHFRLDPYTRLTVSNVNFFNWSLKIFLAYWSHLSIYGCVKNWWTSCRFSQQIQSWWCSWGSRSKIGHFWMSVGVNQAAVFSPWAHCKEK